MPDARCPMPDARARARARAHPILYRVWKRTVQQHSSNTAAAAVVLWNRLVVPA
eukprot:CAMPEP_0206446310 /NCGR_PEP_ID=MMETSP0324_2-20121206/16058_1 /ASSEMBLY_ACC=CAM_ASM_000836 /TAXON_ID=2866 /ORGANISM="Crypthecodinium cohnii, Strain Seligo" /LENGTH=53 /DNA_ID=CAMNT_0053914753 /DNA_START=112 /DNA_END=270 /DNA_ORIENTATION=+